jgi:Serpin (serine protease inhibitor).
MKKRLILFCLLLLGACGPSGHEIPSETKDTGSAGYHDKNYRIIAEANNRFAIELFKQILEKEGNGNLFISPASIHIALAMAEAGAAGKTAEEMSTILHIGHLKEKEKFSAYDSLLDLAEWKDYGVTLNIANSLWIREGYPFLESYLKNVKSSFHAKVEEVDMARSDTADKMNEWVKKQTNNKIKNIIQELRPDTVSVLLNAIYFKGDWKKEFDEKRTYEGEFLLSDGRTTNHPFMIQEGEYNYIENDLFQAVELPYRGEHTSMIVVVPKEGKTLQDFFQHFSFEMWNGWMGGFSSKEGTVALPRFQMEYEVPLSESLMALGMTSAFSREADFSKMVENGGIHISDVLHKSFIEVNEKGTEASGATAVIIVESVNTEHFSFTADRPFFFAILDKESGMFLFMGNVFQPDVKN